MWCPDCRQDVPGIATASEGRFCCARCQGPVGRRPSRGWSEQAPSEEGIDLANREPVPQHPPVQRADWETRQQFRPINRLLAQAAAREPAAGEFARRWDLPVAPAPDRPREELERPLREAIRTGRPSPLPWTLIAVGLALLSGSAGLAWARLHLGPPQLPAIAAPLGLAGHCTLLAGLLLELGRLRRASRAVVRCLETLIQTNAPRREAPPSVRELLPEPHAAHSAIDAGTALGSR